MSTKRAFIVTGAGSGIGKAIAAKIIEQGHLVFGLGRNVSKLEKTAIELGADRFFYSSIDLSDKSQVNNELLILRKWLNEQNLVLQGLVNNAGIFDRMEFNQTPDSVWEHQFQNNLLSAVRLARELFPELKQAASILGPAVSVLNISSTLGLRPIRETSAYSAIKAAMVNWTQCLALEWAEQQIRVNCICPGIVDTPIQSFYGQDSASEMRIAAEKAQPIGHVGQPLDIAEAAWFLLSEKSRWTTGSILTVDGGINL